MIRGNTAGSSAGRTRRAFAIGVTSLTGGAFAVACGAGSTGSTSESKPAPSAVKNASLDAWVHADTRSAWQMKTLEDYNKEKGTSHQITWTKMANTSELADKLVVTTAAGSGFPDLADVEISQMGKLLKTPNPPLVALNDHLMGKEADFFKPSFIDPWSLNGKYYGLGNELNVCLLCYRHDLLQRVGVKTPIATWDDAVQAGRQLLPVAPEGLFFVRGGTVGTFHLLAIQAGGGFLQNGNKLIVNHQSNAKALQFLVDLMHKSKGAALIPGSRPGGDSGSAIFKDAVNTGKVAGEIGPTWRISGGLRVDAPDTGGKWMVQPLPEWTASGPKRTSSWGGTGMTVLKESKTRDVGIDFIIWEHASKAVLHDFDLRQVWPTYKKAYDDPRLTNGIEWFNNQKVGTVLRDAAETMLPFHQGVWWPEIGSAAGKHITAAMRNEKPVGQALDEAQAEAKAAIEAAGGKVEPDNTIR